ncbi:hypothetical protein DKX38_001171 [Salix brachista]|uniref:Uncharacterized protein n=1 Tax=Salix brachista TaxID=2182728 RepID=A0A5N5P3Z1_9ROSI|nr:hypothetical protein DKX38_001171 [Salix brachista]
MGSGCEEWLMVAAVNHCCCKGMTLENHVTEQIVGSTDQQPLLETPGEVFELRKLLPPSLLYDFNIHVSPFALKCSTLYFYRVWNWTRQIMLQYWNVVLKLLEAPNFMIMDFQPGEFLNVKEVHYNHHGLLLLEGQGIYRLGDNWYAALGKTRTRCLLYKDVNRNPL